MDNPNQQEKKIESVAIVGDGGRERNTGKMLYLCFFEYKHDGTVVWVIKAINTKDLISPDVTSNPSPSSSTDPVEPLLQVGLISGSQKYLPFFLNCEVYGSQILFAGGRTQEDNHVVESREILVFETVDPNPTFKEGCFPRFKSVKPEPLLMQPKDGSGKLYAVAGRRPLSESRDLSTFEVFDPRKGEWSPLQDPPLFERTLKSDRLGCYNLGYAIAGTNIFLWAPTTPTYRFDVSEPEKGWLQHSTIPLTFSTSAGVPLVLDVDEEEEDGIHYLMFVYDADCASDNYMVYFMSQDFSVRHFRYIRLPLLDQVRLPEQLFPPDGYRFVHLGGQKVCLVLNKFFPSIHDHPLNGSSNCYFESERMMVVLITFEYEIDKTKPLKWDNFKVQPLGTRILEYDTKRDFGIQVAKMKTQHEYGYEESDTLYSFMVGAFLLDDPVSVECKEQVQRTKVGAYQAENSAQVSNSTPQQSTLSQQGGNSAAMPLPSSAAFYQQSIPPTLNCPTSIYPYGYSISPYHMPPLHQFSGHNGFPLQPLFQPPVPVAATSRKEDSTSLKHAPGQVTPSVQICSPYTYQVPHLTYLPMQPVFYARAGIYPPW